MRPARHLALPRLLKSWSRQIPKKDSEKLRLLIRSAFTCAIAQTDDRLD